MNEATVSVVIPTWQGADVIGDSIGCALRQTHARLQIIVAVDASTDETASIASAEAARDDRIEVLVHPERIGWTRNTNAGLARVQGDFFFLYFHDDLVEPDYIETLLAHLSANPGAGCAYASVIQDQGPVQTEDAGRASTGTAFERLMDRLLRQTGAPLRALTRAHLLQAGLRFPEASFWGWQAQLAYLVRLMGAADVLYEPRALYRRRNWRKGALTKGWTVLDPDIIAQDACAILDDVKRAANDLLHDDAERAAVLIAADLVVARTIRMWEKTNRIEHPLPLDTLTPRVAKAGELPKPYAALGAALATQILDLGAAAAAQRSGV